MRLLEKNMMHSRHGFLSAVGLAIRQPPVSNIGFVALIQLCSLIENDPVMPCRLKCLGFLPTLRKSHLSLLCSTHGIKTVRYCAMMRRKMNVFMPGCCNWCLKKKLFQHRAAASEGTLLRLRYCIIAISNVLLFHHLVQMHRIPRLIYVPSNQAPHRQTMSQSC